MKKSLQTDLIDFISESRLSSYKYDNADNATALERYLYNIELSKSLYPVLSILEVWLRNKLDEAIENNVKKDWLMQELAKQDILAEGERNKLIDTKMKLIKKGKSLTKEHLLAELSLGFWVHLCSKRYKDKLWHRKNFFKTVFKDYPNSKEFDKLRKIFPLLQLFLIIRNRIFHHEIIINNPYGIQNCYYKLRTLLGYISQDSLLFLDRVCNFQEVLKNNNPRSST